MVGFLKKEFKVEGIMSGRLKPYSYVLRAGERMQGSQKFRETIFIVFEVNFETTSWSAAHMMQQSCLYLEISIPTKYTDMVKHLLKKIWRCCLPQRIRLGNHVNRNGKR